MYTAGYLLSLFLSIHLLAAQMASGKDIAADNHTSVVDGGGKYPRHEDSSPYHSLPAPLRQRMEKEREPLHSRDEFLRSIMKGMGKRQGAKVAGNPLFRENVTGNIPEGANAATVTWSIETADAPKSFSYPSSRAIAVDSNNHPHIVYGGECLYYAYYDGVIWRYETVDSSWVGNFASIAIGTSDHVHISYHDENKSLKYVTNESGSWEVTIVDGSHIADDCNSIALDTSGHAHISYLDVVNYDLRYATNASGAWVTTTVDAPGIVGYESSIKLDTNDKAHISYGDFINGDIKYATNKSGKWITTRAATNGDVSWCSSLALDASNHAHISHYDETKSVLCYTTNASGKWVTTTVEDSGSNSSIALDAAGRIHISYPNNSDLYYATSIQKPTAITKPAANITKTSARLKAKVNANRLQTEVWFEWGTVSGGPYQNTSPKKTVSGGQDWKEGCKAEGLTEATTYYYRVVAGNEDGITYEDEASFKTKK